MALNGSCLGGLVKLEKDFTPKNNVLIVGAGPSAWNLRYIDLSQYTIITVNSACVLIEGDIHFMYDAGAWHTPWWEHLRGKRHVICDILIKAACGYPHDYYSFPYLSPIQDIEYKPWTLNSGGRVVGRAIQLAASWPNVNTIHLVGCEYHSWDIHYWDFTDDPHMEPQPPYGHPKQATERLLKHYTNEGKSIGHYGRTALNITQLAIPTIPRNELDYHPNAAGIVKLRPACTLVSGAVPDNVPDIFSSDIKLPETVYIVATGENGKDYYDYIPKDACTIGLNGALEIGIPFTYYIAFDLECPRQDWWYCDMGDAIPIFGTGIAHDPRCKYYFKYRPALQQYQTMYDLIPGVLRGGASISACAIQFAYYFGAKRIIMVGVDMGGTRHWNGTDVGKAGRPRWTGADKIEILIEAMLREKEKYNPGFEGVYTLSPSQIRVKQIEPEPVYEIEHTGRPYVKPLRHKTWVTPPLQPYVNPDCKEYFDSDLHHSIPRDVYVLAAGAKGQPYHSQIPKDAFVFSVNSAILIRKPTAWMVFDKRLKDQPWYEPGMKVDTLRLFGERAATLAHAHYHYKVEPHLFWEPYDCLIEGSLRGGATVAGCAMQAAFWGGARRIILCGVDMEGRDHYDGTVSGVPGYSDGAWDCLGNVNMLVKTIQKAGVEVVSMSPTMIDVDVLNG
ncbi:MAG TPA: hypothetical protein VLH56_19180 [Dissulfurispiraceae bacterium]|nr:hypothetical protein [Dissulfurispiraceae bacterium]